jgi:O-antigen ligase
VILCRTRSAFIGFTCGGIAALLLTPKARRFTIYGLFILGGVAGYSLTDNFFWDRMATLLDPHLVEKDEATAVRKQIWEASLHMIADYPQGIGPGNFTQLIGEYDARHYHRATHNSLVVCFVELGIQGGIVFLAMVCGSMYLLYRCSKLAPQTDYPLETKIYAYGFLISFVTYFVTALGTQRFYCESFWWVMSLPLCLHRVVQREVAAREVVPALCDRPAPYEQVERYGTLEPAM